MPLDWKKYGLYQAFHDLYKLHTQICTKNERRTDGRLQSRRSNTWPQFPIRYNTDRAVLYPPRSFAYSNRAFSVRSSSSLGDGRWPREEMLPGLPSSTATCIFRKALRSLKVTMSARYWRTVLALRLLSYSVYAIKQTLVDQEKW